MRKELAAICLVFGLVSTANAQMPPEAMADPAVQLALNALPPIQDERTRTSIAVYSRVAQAWWVQSRCKIGDAKGQQAFSDDMALLTQVMRGTLRNLFKVEQQKAGEYTETIQMYALNAMSANKFYGCGEQAQNLVQKAAAAAQQLVANIRQQIPSATPAR